MKEYLITAGILRKGDQLLLIKHDSEFGSKPFWTLPGGTSEEGENGFQSITREIKEETGLSVEKIHKIAYKARHTNHKRMWISNIEVYEIAQWNGELFIDDPDGDIIDVQWFSVKEAITLLKEGPFEVMKVPIVSYLEQNPSDTPFWHYVEDKKGNVSLTYN